MFWCKISSKCALVRHKANRIKRVVYRPLIFQNWCGIFSFFIISIFRFWNKSSSLLKEKYVGGKHSRISLTWLINNHVFIHFESVYSWFFTFTNDSRQKHKYFLDSWFVFVTNEFGMKVLVGFIEYRTFKT